MWKNVVHTQSNPDTIARWSSITFFLYTLYINTLLIDVYGWISTLNYILETLQWVNVKRLLR
jgi:hypothetical protein